MSLFSEIAGLFGGEEPDYEAAAFKPYNVVTPFGRAKFNAERGRVVANLSPELQQFYNDYLGAARGLMPTEEQLAFSRELAGTGRGLFDQYNTRLQEALGYDVGQATSDYYNQMQDILAPQRAQEESRLADTLFKTGRTGAGVGVEGGYLNPEQFALLKARENQNAELLLNAEDRARAIRDAQIAEATGGMTNALGIFGTGTSLPSTLYGTSQGMLGGAMQIPSVLGGQIGYGLQAGQASSAAGANMAQMQQQQYNNNLGFWGGLMQGGSSLLGKSGWWTK
jgi:hypothetical protein